MNNVFRTKCRSCNAHIVMTNTDKGKMMPINYDESSMKNELPKLYDKERHISHFATCPNAKKHRKGKPRS